VPLHLQRMLTSTNNLSNNNPKQLPVCISDNSAHTFTYRVTIVITLTQPNDITHRVAVDFTVNVTYNVTITVSISKPIYCTDSCAINVTIQITIHESNSITNTV
jgi:hypothetical protein